MKVNERGQVTTPQKIRGRFGLSPATDVEFVERHGELILEKKVEAARPVGKYVGVLKGRGSRTDNLLKAMRGG